MENEFIKDPVQVTVLGVNRNKFYIKSKIVFVGNVPKNIKDELAKTMKPGKNKVLENFYGSNWRYKLGFIDAPMPDVSGGDEEIDIMSDIDDIDESVDLFDISDITGEVPKVPVVKPISEEVKVKEEK